MSFDISFKMATKCGSKKSAPRVSLARFMRSLAFSAIISRLELSCLRKQRMTAVMEEIKHSGREDRRSSMRSREISMILMTVSVSNF